MSYFVWKISDINWNDICDILWDVSSLYLVIAKDMIDCGCVEWFGIISMNRLKNKCRNSKKTFSI